MKFEIGDQVLVLHSNEQGEVVDVINSEMVMVDVRGVKFPAYIDQLDFPYYKKFTEKRSASEKPKQFLDNIKKEPFNPRSKSKDGMWFIFLPVFEEDEFGDEYVKEFKLHMTNNTNQGYNFKYSLQLGDKTDFELLNQIHVFEDFYLHDIDFDRFNDSPLFYFDFSLITPDKKKVKIFQTSLKLKAKSIFLKTEQMKMKNEASFSYKIFDDYPEMIPVRETDIFQPSSKEAPNFGSAKILERLDPPKHEIDLHIEMLTDKWTNMGGPEILALQIQVFEKYLELAIIHHLHSMIVIHGLGSGRLRDEIHELLRMKKSVKYFVNQYDPRYGYGATEIFFQ